MESEKQELRWVLRAQAGDREALDELLRAGAALSLHLQPDR